MEYREQRNKLQCIVDEGIILNRRDMVRILRDLGHVRYLDLQDGTLRREGEGLVVSVLSSPNSSTIVVNKRLYLNVNNFQYLKLGQVDGGGAAIDLIDEGRVLRLLPQTDPLLDQTQIVADDGLAAHRGSIERLFGEGLAEVYLDDESDDDE